MEFLAQGVPLVLGGDEFLNSQQGNNNAYCQDNKTGWLNWKKQKKETWLAEFIKNLADFRREHPIIASEHPMELMITAGKVSRIFPIMGRAHGSLRYRLTDRQRGFCIAANMKRRQIRHRMIISISAIIFTAVCRILRCRNFRRTRNGIF